MSDSTVNPFCQAGQAPSVRLGGPLLSLRGVTVRCGATVAVRRADLAVGAGELVALVGLNGAGKSSLLRTIAGLNKPAAGSIRLDGVEIGGIAPETLAARGLAFVPEGGALFDRLTVEENLELGAWLVRDSRLKKERFDRVYSLFPILAKRRKQPAGALSGGERRMCALGRAYAAGPRLFLLDEPSLGLAPLTTKAVFEALLAINQAGASVLLVEQNVRRALEIATTGVVMLRGVTAKARPAAELLADKSLMAACLGLDDVEY